jgi:hypothetical protein
MPQVGFEATTPVHALDSVAAVVGIMSLYLLKT